MRLDFVHLLSARLDAVEAALLDPTIVSAFGAGSRVIASAELRAYEDADEVVRREAFYALRPEAWPGAGRRLMPRIAWTERVTWRRREHGGTFVVAPEVPAPLERRARCEGRYVLVSRGLTCTERRIEGVLVIDAPFVGARAEALLAPILATFFEEEARLVGARAEGA
ncbi:DUF2505 family protein [Polyangium sp. y55x31]|uniref:DUF2505 family protein n=1 Tax=Polyangium sp. y55x31 TaxID=3042688 RepID=UPI0024826D63|nr:DUF2505 family protein [Polyangium sp. y55x31]MDI1483469.1 DUF2505 family protein [Polyangium sp. y55x31]